MAQQLANEIESQPAYKQRIEMENGDEETLYAAVYRPNQENNYSVNQSSSLKGSYRIFNLLIFSNLEIGPAKQFVHRQIRTAS